MSASFLQPKNLLATLKTALLKMTVTPGLSRPVHDEKSRALGKHPSEAETIASASDVAEEGCVVEKVSFLSKLRATFFNAIKYVCFCSALQVVNRFKNQIF